MRECRLDWCGSRCGLVTGSCEHGNKISVSVESGNFLTSCANGSFSRRIVLHKACFSVNWWFILRRSQQLRLSPGYIASNKEWQGYGKKLLWCFKELTVIRLEQLRKLTKTTASIAGLRTDILTRDLPGTKQQRQTLNIFMTFLKEASFLLTDYTFEPECTYWNGKPVFRYLISNSI